MKCPKRSVIKIQLYVLNRSQASALLASEVMGVTSPRLIAM